MDGTSSVFKRIHKAFAKNQQLVFSCLSLSECNCTTLTKLKFVELDIGNLE